MRATKRMLRARRNSRVIRRMWGQLHNVTDQMRRIDIVLKASFACVSSEGFLTVTPIRKFMTALHPGPRSSIAPTSVRSSRLAWRGITGYGR